jgi:sugar/nucleoside kinase (ribokinase family)
MKIKDGKTKIVGIGGALVDLLIHESDDFIQRTGFEKGGMTYVDPSELDRILGETSAHPTVVPGGSAGNTVVGIGQLGGLAAFVGKRGKDESGQFFEKALSERNVSPCLMTSHIPTGRVLSIITPDAQRTMLTYLGASASIRPEEITAEHFSLAAVVHMEGYLLFNSEVMTASLKAAKQAGALISLDLASFTVVEKSKGILDDIIAPYVDILLANEDEARAYTGEENEEKALAKLAQEVEIAVVKVGARGSFIRHEGQIYRVAAHGTAPVIDTTGAGDLWASGFLFGLVSGYAMEKCGELASACGYEVCRVVGAHIPDDGWKRIKRKLEE